MDKRLCVVGEKTGYFHMWEQYSMPVQESILKGGSPGGGSEQSIWNCRV